MLFSITREKVYPRLNGEKNLYFNAGFGPRFGYDCLDINGNQLRGDANYDPFKIPKNASGEQELVE